MPKTSFDVDKDSKSIISENGRSLGIGPQQFMKAADESFVSVLLIAEPQEEDVPH